MKKIVEKVAIFSMIGMMQLGLGVSVMEASPLHTPTEPQRYEREEGRPGGNHFERERHERERIENERHEREMQRRPHETRRQWRERQKQENERHERELRKIREMPGHRSHEEGEPKNHHGR